MLLEEKLASLEYQGLSEAYGLLPTEDLKLILTYSEFLGRLYVLLNLAKTHERQNQAVVEAAELLYSILIDISDEAGHVRIDIVNDSIYINGVRIPTPATKFNMVRSVVREFKDKQIGSLTFKDDAESTDMIGLAFLLARPASEGKITFEKIRRLIQVEGISGIKIGPRIEDRELHDGLTSYRQRIDAKRALLSAIGMLKDAVKGGITEGRINPRRAKRAIESVVDSILADEDAMLALTMIRNYDEYTYQHSFNVCVYSIALANRLGLPRRLLADIGVAALFHDIGKTAIPHALLNKSTDPSKEEWEIIRSHTILGVKLLANLKKIDTTTLRSMIVAFSHHLNLDRTGYPKLRSDMAPDLVSQIVRIADIFDALTSSRPYRSKPFSPRQAIEILYEGTGSEVNEALTGIFASLILRPEEQVGNSLSNRCSDLHGVKSS